MSFEHNGQTFTIKGTTEPVGGDRESRAILGLTDEGENLIIFDGTVPETRQSEIILHEIFHVMDMTLPEFMINILGQNFYGAAKANGLEIDTWLRSLVDGDATREEADLINDISDDIAEMQMGMVGREVDEGPWNGDPIVKVEGNAAIHQYELRVSIDGKVNRSACYLAQSRLMGSGASPYNPANHKAMCRELVALFKEFLDEEPDRMLSQLAR